MENQRLFKAQREQIAAFINTYKATTRAINVLNESTTRDSNRVIKRLNKAESVADGAKKKRVASYFLNQLFKSL